MSRIFDGLFGVAGCAVIAFTCSRSLAQEGDKPAAPAPGKAAGLPAHFQATVYEVQTTPEQVSSFDGKALTSQADTAETLLKALSEKGKARILYRIDQPVNVASERIQIGEKQQVVTGKRVMANGQSINSITYVNVGVLIQLSTRDPAGDQAQRTPEVSLSAELSALTESDKELTSGVKMITPRNLKFEHSEALQFERPSVTLSISSASSEDQAAPVAYVVRYRFSAPVGK